MLWFTNKAFGPTGLGMMFLDPPHWMSLIQPYQNIYGAHKSRSEDRLHLHGPIRIIYVGGHNGSLFLLPLYIAHIHTQHKLPQSTNSK